MQATACGTMVGRAQGASRNLMIDCIVNPAMAHPALLYVVLLSDTSWPASSCACKMHPARTMICHPSRDAGSPVVRYGTESQRNLPFISRAEQLTCLITRRKVYSPDYFFLHPYPSSKKPATPSSSFCRVNTLPTAKSLFNCIQRDGHAWILYTVMTASRSISLSRSAATTLRSREHHVFPTIRCQLAPRFL